MEHRTSFVIAHRSIYRPPCRSDPVMDHGRIVERGRHDELLALNGIYTRLCANSFMDTGAGVLAGVGV